jgi:Stage II sporulation protein E (SpoIIE)
MARRRRETIAGTLDFVRIAVAFGAGQGNRLGGNEFVERNALAVNGDVTVFRISNLQKVHSNARQTYGLCGGRAFVRGRQPQQTEVIHHKKKGGTNQDANQEAHPIILARAKAQFKGSDRASCIRKQWPPFPSRIAGALLDFFVSPNFPLRCDAGPSKNEMNTIAPLELQALEKLREEELEEARAIQSVMLPAESLRAGAVTISHAFQPIAAVGGDFLDYFVLTDGTIGLYLGDVSGKGLPAALYAALAVGTLRGVHKTGTSPHDVLGTLNRRLMIRGMPRRHAAMQYGVFDPHSHELQVASAGMPGPFYLCANGCRSLELTGMPPGLFATSSYETLTLQLQPGDSVLFCTDGITDAFDHKEDQFGIERLQELCDAHQRAAPAKLLGRVFAAVESFARGREQHDDMAAALFHFCG